MTSGCSLVDGVKNERRDGETRTKQRARGTRNMDVNMVQAQGTRHTHGGQAKYSRLQVKACQRNAGSRVAD